VSLTFLVLAAVPFVLAAVGGFWATCFERPREGHALVINGAGSEPQIAFGPQFVLPIITRVEQMDLRQTPGSRRRCGRSCR
jgi:uncharacterized membrane protein YqiK